MLEIFLAGGGGMDIEAYANAAVSASPQYTLQAILLTALATSLGAFVAYTVGQLVYKAYIETYYDFQALLGLLEHELFYHADKYSNPVLPGRAFTPEYQEAQKKLRGISSLLLVKYRLAPSWWVKKRLNITRKDVLNASKRLVRVSNSLAQLPSGKNPALDNEEDIKEVQRLLKLG